MFVGEVCLWEQGWCVRTCDVYSSMLPRPLPLPFPANPHTGVFHPCCTVPCRCTANAHCTHNAAPTPHTVHLSPNHIVSMELYNVPTTSLSRMPGLRTATCHQGMCTATVDLPAATSSGHQDGGQTHAAPSSDELTTRGKASNAHEAGSADICVTIGGVTIECLEATVGPGATTPPSPSGSEGTQASHAAHDENLKGPCISVFGHKIACIVNQTDNAPVMRSTKPATGSGAHGAGADELGRFCVWPFC